MFSVVAFMLNKYKKFVCLVLLIGKYTDEMCPLLALEYYKLNIFLTFLDYIEDSETVAQVKISISVAFVLKVVQLYNSKLKNNYFMLLSMITTELTCLSLLTGPDLSFFRP